VAPLTVIPRVEPPSSLSTKQRGLWHGVVAAMPADWWNASNVSLLVEYVRAVEMVDILAEKIGKEKDFASLKDLLKLRDMESKRVMSLATKMRLSQQSSYTDKSADTAKRGAGGRKPWLTEG
jgi:hypothetical protein